MEYGYWNSMKCSLESKIICDALRNQNLLISRDVNLRCRNKLAFKKDLVAVGMLKICGIPSVRAASAVARNNFCCCRSKSRRGLAARWLLPRRGRGEFSVGARGKNATQVNQHGDTRVRKASGKLTCYNVNKRAARTEYSIEKHQLIAVEGETESQNTHAHSYVHVREQFNGFSRA